MTTMKIDDVKEEMEVISNVLDARGNVLLKQGSKLTEAWIERLKKRGISELDVALESESAGPDAGGVTNGLGIEDLQEHMKKIFSSVLGEPHMKSLARSTYQYLKVKNE